MKPLDFLIIGAQKCATTTLFEQLRAHPDIAMPMEKEVPYFTQGAPSRDSWGRFQHRYFPDAGKRLLGKATPQYLCDPEVAQRIAGFMPGVKLVAILRDPIERSWSHYRMDCRRGTEQRPFQAVVEELLDPAVAERNRALPVPGHDNGYESESAFHVAWSEYGRALDPYLVHFPADQLQVIYLEDLARDPEGTLDRLLSFLGLEPGFRPPALGKVVHAGGAGNRVPHGVRERLRQLPVIRYAWQALSEERRGRLRFLYERWNGAASGSPVQPELTPQLRARLGQHFAADLRRLRSSPIAPPPWLGRYEH